MNIYPLTQVRPYVYFGIHKITGEIYIGYREINKIPSDQDIYIYRTSSKTVHLNFDDYVWIILAEFFTGNDAFDFEQELIAEHWSNPLLLNGQYRLKNGNKRFKSKKGIKHNIIKKRGPHSEEHKAKIGKSNTGKKQSTDARNKKSIALLGRIPWNKGIPSSKEANDKKSISMTGRPFSDTHRENLSKAGKGISKERVICPHCLKVGGKGNMIRYHFANCKCLQVRLKL